MDVDLRSYYQKYEHIHETHGVTLLEPLSVHKATKENVDHYNRHLDLDNGRRNCCLPGDSESGP